MFSALLDTCVLVPSVKRDVLLEVAERMVYRPLWSSAILGELGRAIHTIQSKKGGDTQVTEAYVRRLTTQMAVAFPDALVVEWERLVGTIELPDPNDRHVVAAAVAGRADVIVTENGKHFPTEPPTPLFSIAEHTRRSQRRHPACGSAAECVGEGLSPPHGQSAPRGTPPES